MSRVRLISALYLSFVALLHVMPAEAGAATTERPTEWAQPVEVQYNLFQMSPTLYRSALPNDGVLPLLDKLKVRTVITFLPLLGVLFILTVKGEDATALRNVHADLVAIRLESAPFGGRAMVESFAAFARNARSSRSRCST